MTVYKELLEEQHITLPAFIKIEHIRDKNYIDALKKELYEGEAEAIVLAKEKDADILLIDESYHLDNEILKKIRLLTNYQIDSYNALTVILCGLVRDSLNYF